MGSSVILYGSSWAGLGSTPRTGAGGAERSGRQGVRECRISGAVVIFGSSMTRKHSRRRCKANRLRDGELRRVLMRLGVLRGRALVVGVGAVDAAVPGFRLADRVTGGALPEVDAAVHRHHLGDGRPTDRTRNRCLEDRQGASLSLDFAAVGYVSTYFPSGFCSAHTLPHWSQRKYTAYSTGARRAHGRRFGTAHRWRSECGPGRVVPPMLPRQAVSLAHG
jgi:hypothetical protein